MRILNNSEINLVNGGFWGGIARAISTASALKSIRDWFNERKDYEDPTHGGGFGNCCEHSKDRRESNNESGSFRGDVMHDTYDRGRP